MSSISIKSICYGISAVKASPNKTNSLLPISTPLSPPLVHKGNTTWWDYLLRVDFQNLHHNSLFTSLNGA